MEAVTDISAQERSLNTTLHVTVTVVLATVTMTFGAMIAVFLYRSLAPTYWGHLKIPVLLWVTTSLLLASSVTVEKARHLLLQAHDQVGFYLWMRWTFALGLGFLVGQVTAWIELLQSGLVLQKNPHSWFIFLFSGLHGAHIIGGLLGVGYLLLRTREPASGPKYQMQTRVWTKGVAICWHYLDFLWVLMFVLLLTWRR